jgi:hypothetical protein
MISAEIIADSLNQFGNRCTTFILTFPRVVLAEFNTHKMIVKSSASSRAIPFKRMVRDVQENPFIPIKWMKSHKGMQGTEYFDDKKDGELLDNIVNEYLICRDNAIQTSKQLNDWGVTKQVCNRLLEPFKWHTIIATGTEWENFFALRAHKDAEIHIQDLAYKMLECYNQSEPKRLMAGEWHIPFGDRFDESRIYDVLVQENINIDGSHKTEFTDKQIEDIKLKISVARAARTSYENFEGKDDYLADIKLHDRLLEVGHMGPAEHVAQAMTTHERNIWIRGKGDFDFDDSCKGWCGPFQGFIQYRKMLPNENRTDSRVIKKL